MNARQEPECFSVAIIGASLAGCQTALELGKKHISTALFDRSEFPRQKACGEGLSHLAIPFLKRHLPELVGSVSLKPFIGYSLGTFKQDCDDYLLDFKTPRGYGVSRENIDSLLVEKARTYHSVSLFLNEGITAIERSPLGWKLSSKDRQIICSYLVIADGSNSPSERFFSEQPASIPSKRVSFTVTGLIHSGQILHTITIIPTVNGEIYLTPLNEHKLNLSFVGDVAFINSCRENQCATIVEILKERYHLNISIIHHGIGASRFSARRLAADEALFRVGDACETFDPACGLGMTHALVSAVNCAAFIDQEMRQQAWGSSVDEYKKVQSQLGISIRFLSFSIRTLFALRARYPKVFKLIHASIVRKLISLYEHIVIEPQLAAVLKRANSLS